MPADFTWRPRGGLVERYLDVYGPTTDAAVQYHIFTCLSVMASVVGRRVWIRDGAAKLYLNLFVLLLGPSSLYRKSTCVGIGYDLLRDLEAGSTGRDGILYPSQFTPESFMEILQQQPAGLIVIDEFRSFLDGMRRDYNAGLRELFMTLYDGRSLHRKIRSAEFKIESPCVSLLSACATSWFTEATKQGEIRSGFYPRLVMVPAWPPKRHYLARGAAPDRTARQLLLGKLNALRTVSGEMQLPHRLEQTFGEWAIQRQRTIEGSEHEAELASFYTRLERITLKLAGLLQLADNPETLEISQFALADAMNLVTWLQDGLSTLFAEEFTFTRDAADKQRLLRFIERQPGIERRELLRLSHMKVNTFDPTLDTLRQEGSVGETQNDKGKRGFYPASHPSLVVTTPPVTHSKAVSSGGF